MVVSLYDQVVKRDERYAGKHVKLISELHQKWKGVTFAFPPLASWFLLVHFRQCGQDPSKHMLFFLQFIFLMLLQCILRPNSSMACNLRKLLASSSRLIGASFSQPQVRYIQSGVAANQNIKVTMVPGDGVGPELMMAVKAVFKAAAFPVEFEEFWISEIQDRCSEDVIEKAADSILSNHVAITGDISSRLSAMHGELASTKFLLRRRLDLFANVVRVKSFEGYKTRHDDLDIVVIREQTEGEYSALEHESVPGVIESLKIITRKKSERIAKFAFDYATKHGRRKVTAVHKANIMKLGDGMFLESCRDVAKLYPKIEFESLIVDNTCMQLVSKPNQFDVMVMPNLYGNIIDNLTAGLVGGAGVVPGESYSRDCVVFETGARHPFAQAVGRNIANPTAMLLTAANMLHHLHLNKEAKHLGNAVTNVINKGKVRTADLQGYATTTEFTHAVIDEMGRL